MPHFVCFDRFEVDLDAGELRSRGTKIKLRDQSFQVLASLLEHPGRLVTREELRHRLWRNQVFVDFDNSLNIAVARLREALGDSADHPRFIETLPKRGYRFLASISSPDTSARTAAVRPRLVVLPFVNLSGDPAQEYFNDAMTDELITEIASLVPEHLAVIARTTAMLYKVRPKDVATIGRELAVDYVVEGSIRRDENQIGINVQLIEVNDQTHLFSKRYHATSNEIFSLQRCIAREIAAHLPAAADVARGSMELARERRREPTTNLTAYNEYIQGRFDFFKATPEAFAAAKQHFERAVLLDPQFALAHDALAEFYWYQGYTGIVSPREAFTAGIVHAMRAIEIDNTLAETHALLGEFHKTLGYDWGEVHREMEIARQLDANAPLVRMRYAVSELMPHGRLDEAIAELERALELDPFSLLIRAWKGIILVLSRRFEEALVEADKLMKLDASYYLAYFIRGHVYRYQQRYADALVAQRKAVELSGDAPYMFGWLGLTLAASGDAAGSRAVLRELHRMELHSYVPPSSFAWIHLGLKELDAAFVWLDRAAQECDQLMMPIKSYAFLDPIRSDPRFGNLLRRMNLAG